MILSPTAGDIKKAVDLLTRGLLVAFPTETVYGLGASINIKSSLKKLYEIKERPTSSPVGLLVLNMEMVEQYISNVPEEAYRLAKFFWPGPLTLIVDVHTSTKLPKIIMGEGNTIGLRAPSNKIALELIEEVNAPITGPSANKYGGLPPLSAEDVVEEFDGSIDAVINGGESPIGIESTVIDLSTTPFRLIRPGPVLSGEIEKVVGRKVVEDFRSSLGHKYKLRIKVIYVRSCSLVSPEDIVGAVSGVLNSIRLRNPLILCTDETEIHYLSKGIYVESLGSRSDPLKVGKNLIKILRRENRERKRTVIIEPLPCDGLWKAVNLRVLKSASKVLNY